MIKICLAVCLATELFCGLVITVSATTFTESGDTGQFLTTAQLLPRGTDLIKGSLLPRSNDVDIFGFDWWGGEFYVDSLATTFDSQLFLFDSNGRGIQSNDDGIAPSGAAFLQLSLQAGKYFLAISEFDNEPLDSNESLMFPSGDPWDVLYPPYSTTAILCSWNGDSLSVNGGDYNIRIANLIEPAPEPTAVLLFGAGLTGLVAVGRKQARGDNSFHLSDSAVKWHAFLFSFFRPIINFSTYRIHTFFIEMITNNINEHDRAKTCQN